MKPTKNDFGYTVENKWLHGNYHAYLEALHAWGTRIPGIPGRKRVKPVHPTWEPYMSLFDSSDSTRSQGAFCRFVGVQSSVLSNALGNGISDKWIDRIKDWKESLQNE